MGAGAYYNEIDPVAAHVLRALISEAVIVPGDVDTRSIKDVNPDDLRGYTQCHFFAGGGLWSVAARLAGWPDDRELWTGSCPCQPFSQAGQGRGVADERHLWPDFHRLISARRPAVVVGEQVAGKAGYGWLDGVRTDLGAEGYASGAVDIPAAAVDAPHIRQRLYWVAVEHASRLGRREGRPESEFQRGRATVARPDAPGVGLADACSGGHRGWQEAPERQEIGGIAPERFDGGHMGNTSSDGRQQGQSPASIEGHGDQPSAAHGGELADSEVKSGPAGLRQDRAQQYWPLAPNSVGRNGSFWAGAEWIICHDGKARRTEPSIRLLVDGMAGRSDLWRIAGNSINPVLAAEVLGAVLDCYPEQSRRAA